jgi:hypothetical protein
MYHHLLSKIKQVCPQWKEASLKNTLLVVALLLEEKTCNLWQLKGSVGKLLGNTTTDSRSHYQRLKRWLWSAENHKRIWIEMLRTAVSLLKEKSVCLLLDGTSWQWGGKTYHFLTLSLLYQGVSIPIFWLDLSRLGSSSQWQRKLLLRLALVIFELKGKVLLGDREYVGHEWFEALTRAQIDFCIRLRKGNYEQQIAQAGKPVEKLEKKAKARIGRIVWQKFCLQDQWNRQDRWYTYVLVGYRTRSGKVDLLRLITTLTPAAAVNHYRYRYRIESMFRHLKSNGFDLQSLHLQKAYKVQMMMAALVLAYTLAIVYGLKKYKRKITIKKHGCAEMSVFRWGLDKWQNHLQTFACFLDQLATYYELWIKPKNKLLKANVP